MYRTVAAPGRGAETAEHRRDRGCSRHLRFSFDGVHVLGAGFEPARNGVSDRCLNHLATRECGGDVCQPAFFGYRTLCRPPVQRRVGDLNPRDGISRLRISSPLPYHARRTLHDHPTLVSGRQLVILVFAHRYEPGDSYDHVLWIGVDGSAWLGDHHPASTEVHHPI